MAQTAAFLTTLVMIVLAALAAGNLRYLAPYRGLLFSRHGEFLLAYAAMHAANVFVLFLLASRRLALRRTGDKLHHLEREGVLAAEIAAMTADPTDRPKA